MNKIIFEKIIDSYQAAEDEVFRLDKEFGICIWNAYTENFYNKYNYIIHQLFIEAFGEEKTEMIEAYLFDETSMTYEELVNFIYDE